MGYTPGGGPGSLPVKTISPDKIKIKKLKAENEELKKENKKLRQDIENMIAYAPGSEKYNKAKEYFDSLISESKQKI